MESVVLHPPPEVAAAAFYFFAVQAQELASLLAPHVEPVPAPAPHVAPVPALVPQMLAQELAQQELVPWPPPLVLKRQHRERASQQSRAHGDCGSADCSDGEVRPARRRRHRPYGRTRGRLQR